MRLLRSISDLALLAHGEENPFRASEPCSVRETERRERTASGERNRNGRASRVA